MTDVMLSSVPRWAFLSIGTTNALVDGTAAYQTPRPRSSGLVPTDGLAPTDGGGKRSAAGAAAVPGAAVATVAGSELRGSRDGTAPG